jgi:hypothetical protein
MSDKKNYVKVGEIRKSKAGKEYLQLGSENPKNPKYNLEVQVMIKDAEGNKVALVKNPSLFFSNPRRPKEDGTVPNIPDFILETVGLFVDETN